MATFTLNAQLPDAFTDSTKIKLDAFLAKQEEEKTFKFGLSIGTRATWGQKSSRSIAYITPDSTIGTEIGDVYSMILSSSIATFPFTKSEKVFWQNFGFLANINLAEFTNDEVGTVFNKAIDGGMGFAIAFGDDKNFALAATYERISIRRPTQYLLDNSGKKLYENGEIITTIDYTNNKYYIDSGLNGMSIKFVFHFK